MAGKSWSRSDQRNTQYGERSGKLTVNLESKPWSNFTFCNRLEAKINLHIQGQAEPVEVGYLVAWSIDKTTKARDGKARWVNTLLQGTPRGQISELGQVLKTLYNNETGKVDEAIKASSGPLDGRIVFLDTLKLNGDFHRCGIAQQALDYFHQLLSTEADIGADTVLLSPARSSDSNWQGLNDVEVEKKLVRMYQREGYQVWLQGDEAVDGSLTIMGKHLDG